MKKRPIDFSRESTPFGFKIVATLEEKIVGYYDLTVDSIKRIAHGVMVSEMPGQHIPRNLIDLAVGEIYRRSCMKRKRITHKEYLVTNESLGLAQIYETKGYTKTDFGDLMVFSRKYD